MTQLIHFHSYPIPVPTRGLERSLDKGTEINQRQLQAVSDLSGPPNTKLLGAELQNDRSVIPHRQEESCMSQHNNQKKSSNKPSPPSADECCTLRTLGRAVLPIQSTQVECRPQGGALHRLGTSRGGHSQEPLYLLHCWAFPDTPSHSFTCPCLVPEGWSNAKLLPSLPSLHSLCWYLCSSLYHPTRPVSSFAICLPLSLEENLPSGSGLESFAHSCFSESRGAYTGTVCEGVEDPCAHPAKS